MLFSWYFYCLINLEMDNFTVQPDQNVKFADSQSSWLRAYKFAVYSLNRVCTIISILPIYDPSVKVGKGLSPNSSYFSYERPLLARNLRG